MDGKLCECRIRTVHSCLGIVSISATSLHVADGEDGSTVTVTVEDEGGSPIFGANVIAIPLCLKQKEEGY